MALQENLNRFNRQQEKCLSTITSITVRAGPLKENQHQKDAARAPPPAYKFANDTERLQLINSIRKSPAGAQIKRVVDLLLETRQSLTAEEINKACYVDVKASKVVFDSLRNNPKVSYNGSYFSYKPKHNAKNKDELLSLIRKIEFREGIAVKDLEDAYPKVKDDLQALKASKEIWLISKSDSKETIAYPNDLPKSISVGDEIKELYREIKLPEEMIEIEKDIKKNRMVPATDTAKRQAVAKVDGTVAKSKPKKKERGITKRTKLTNSHLPELFEYLAGSGT